MKQYTSIALCFSGGGYRAACFSLGTLSLLEKIGLLQNVKAVSTVSGGTITGAKYVQSQIEEKDFTTFYQEFYAWLQEDALAKKAISHLKNNAIWKTPDNKHKRKNPINAFAIEYNTFTNHKTLGEIQEIIANDLKKDENNRKSHLERIIFNATDFDSTEQFRFQNIKGTRKRFGNGKVHAIYKHIINDIKLGDIIAASSAFPGGFEPIGFPSDFTNKYKNTKEIGLMDGGIVDNQGSSVFIPDNVKNIKNSYSLYFISDVSSPYSGKGFKFASESAFNRFASKVSNVYTLLFFLLVTFFFFHKKWFILYTAGVIFSTFLVVIQLLLLLASNIIKKEISMNQRLFLPPSRVGFYIINRVKSLVRMASVVFLKNDRRQHASNLYSVFPNKAITSTSYQLRCNDKNGKQTTKPEYAKNWDTISKHTGQISKKIIENSKIGTSFGTTLWFSKEDEQQNMLDIVIACGEYTACYNLIAHIVTVSGITEETKELYEQLLTLWHNFQSDPHFLVKQRKVNN